MGRFRTFRACLRWEFGFSCAFCLVHEADLFPHAVDGTGLTGIEHHVLKDAGRSPLTDVYANCLYSCRFCNDARGTMPTASAEGHRLLDPCADVWADHFEPSGDDLRPRAGDADALYTWTAYDLDAPQKQVMRNRRHSTMATAWARLGSFREKEARLLAAAELARSTQQRAALAEALLDLRAQAADARRDLLLYAAIPDSAPSVCACSEPPVYELPTFLDEQCAEAP